MTATPAQRFYVLHLNPTSKGMTDRYSVMRLAEDGSLSPLWGELDGQASSDNPRKAAKAWPFMVYVERPTSRPDRYPAFHFALHGYGYSKLQELADGLARRTGVPVELYPVTGWNSSPVKSSRREA